MTGRPKGAKYWYALKIVRDRIRTQPSLRRSNQILQKILDSFFRPSSRETQAFLRNGISMRIPPGYKSFRDLQADAYERETSRIFVRIVESGKNVIDLGANIGYYTLLASKLVGAKGQVFAFEPLPSNLDYLRKNIELNNCSNVVIVPAAAGNFTGDGSFQLYADPTLGHLLRNNHPKENVMHVPTVRLDDFLARQGWPRIDIIKADLEGGEVDALSGMTETCDRNPDVKLLLEYNSKTIMRAGHSVKEFFRAISHLGFRKASIIEQQIRTVEVRKMAESNYDALNVLFSK